MSVRLLRRDRESGRDSDGIFSAKIYGKIKLKR